MRTDGRENTKRAATGLALGAALSVLAMGQAPGTVHAQSTDPLEGAWTADKYVLAEGSVHPVRGQIFFVDGQWQVLFFVIDGGGVARRGSGEGGTYERTPDGVVFRHLYHLSAGGGMQGLEEAPLRMSVQRPEDATLEPTELTLEGDVLTLHFPSGNRMTFQR